MAKLDLEALVPDESVLKELDEKKDEVYNKYTIIFNIMSGEKIVPMELITYLRLDEAYATAKNLNMAIINMTQNNAPVPISIILRNEKHEIAHYGLLGVVGIIHNIPEFDIE